MTRDHSRFLLRCARHLALGAIFLTALSAIDSLPWQYAAWADPNDDDDDDDGELFELDGADDDDDDFGSSTVEMGSSAVGTSENPNSVPEFGVVGDAGKKKKTGKRGPYPVQFARRPLTLDEGTFQIGLQVPAFVSPAELRTGISFDFGITDNVQIGVGYGPGTLGSGGFTVGKSFFVQARYLVFDWLSVEATVPMYADPFSIGFSLGAPMRFRLGQKAAIVLGHELFNVRIFRFLPFVTDANYNEGKVADYDTNEIIPLGDLRFLGGIIYQIDDNLAFMGDIGIIAFNYGLTDSGVPLRATIVYSPSNKIDLAARLGFDNLDQAQTSFGLLLTASFRI